VIVYLCQINVIYYYYNGKTILELYACFKRSLDRYLGNRLVS